MELLSPDWLLRDEQTFVPAAGPGAAPFEGGLCQQPAGHDEMGGVLRAEQLAALPTDR